MIWEILLHWLKLWLNILKSYNYYPKILRFRHFAVPLHHHLITEYGKKTQMALSAWTGAY